MVDAGYRLLRFTAADVLSAPESVVALVRRALRNHD
jgi:very-short-patch-repair endonuclease